MEVYVQNLSPPATPCLGLYVLSSPIDPYMHYIRFNDALEKVYEKIASLRAP
jgi:hypothetical protein